MERAVNFKNKSGHRLFGILHLPENIKQNAPCTGVHILNPGLKNRVAPNRLNVKIARRLCENGLPVLRCDPTGIGDSEGQLCEENKSVLDMWSMIQSGAFVKDTIAANTYFLEEAKLDRLILIGQCGAGVTALLAGGIDERISSLILIDTPFRIVTSEINIQDIMAEYDPPGSLWVRGIQALVSPQKLKRLVTLQFNWRYYANLARVRVTNRLIGDRDKPGPSVHERFNWPMLRAFETFIGRNGTIYFNYAENDFSLKEFNEDFNPNFISPYPSYKKICRVDIIENANHIYTEIAWQEKLLNNICGWLKV